MARASLSIIFQKQHMNKVALVAPNTSHLKLYLEDISEKDVTYGVPGFYYMCFYRDDYHFWARVNAYERSSVAVVLW